MSADILLSKLVKVRQTGRNSWMACCPSHLDKRPSMTIRETDAGIVLVHCFGGCAAVDIIASVGLEMDALFPPKSADGAKPQRFRFPALDILQSIATETMIVAVAASNVRQGIALSADDHQRLLVASERIFEARRIAGGE